jgi:hypothetical protein
MEVDDMAPTVDRYCIVTQGDTHESFRRNLIAAHPPVPIYLRDSHRAQDVREYIPQVQQIEAVCFNEPSPRFALAHFGLNGPAMVVTAEADGQVMAAQYVIWDGHVEGRRGLRFWTTVVHPAVRGQHVASMLTAISTTATRSWAQYGSTICDTNSSLMARNVRLRPTIVTANMFHTEGRRKVQLEWDQPADPFRTLLLSPALAETGEVTRTMHTLDSYHAEAPIQGRFYVPADAQVWDDIANQPEYYRRRFRLVGWIPETRGAILEDTQAQLLELAAPDQVKHEPELAHVLI